MFEARVSKWIANRFEVKSRFKLGHQQLFIFPTRFGFLYLFAVLIIFVLGTNYQNNPILILSYFLFFMFIWSLHACFSNMIRCQFVAMTAKDGFIGDNTILSVKVSKDDNEYLPQQLSIWEGDQSVRFDYSPLQYNVLNLSLPIKHRGLQRPTTLKIKTEYPFGLIQAWSYLRFDTPFWAYPKPVKGNWQFTTIQHVIDYHQKKEPQDTSDEHVEEDIAHQDGIHSDSMNLIRDTVSADRQFDGIRTFVPGSPMSQVAWKQFAKQASGDLLLKDFIDEQQTDAALALTSIKEGTLEEKLSVLTQAVLDLHQQKQPFLLDLSGYRSQHMQVQYMGDDESFQQCLRALSSFGLERTELSNQS